MVPLLVALLLALAFAAPAAASGVQGPPSGREVVLVANAEGGTVSVVDARSSAVLDLSPGGRTPKTHHSPAPESRCVMFSAL